MSISKLADLVDDLDPYAIQRLAMVKGIFIATVLVFVYWVFQPASFTAFIMPAIIIYYYDSPLIQQAKEKETFIIVIFTAFVIGNISFYLIFPFKFIFFYYAILFFIVVYYLLGFYYNQLKTAAMVILAYSLFTLSDSPPANFQVVYNLFFSSFISIFPMLVCLRIYPNGAIEIWSRALQKYLACMEVDIEKAIQGHQKNHDPAEVKHLRTVRIYRKQIPISEMRHAYRISLNIRNIQFALSNIFYETMNEDFWRSIQQSFKLLRMNMKQKTTCPLSKDLVSETTLQLYVVRCLNQAIDHWNQLCCIQNN